MPGLIDPLTSRELEVLQMLAAGKSNQAIAGELVVTLDTVKKHVSHLLGKLGAANRTEAVTRARELGLTPCRCHPVLSSAYSTSPNWSPSMDTARADGRSAPALGPPSPSPAAKPG